MSVANMLIGLREGMEACLIISILTAFLVRAGHRRWVPLVRIGLGCALIVSVCVGSLLFYSRAILSGYGQSIFEAVTSVVALVFVTGMIFWMRHPPQAEEVELNERLAKALRVGPVAALTISFLAVAKEGIEATAFVFVSAAQTGTSAFASLLSLLVGIAVAAVLMWLLYLGAVRINLGVFFSVTGFLLIFVAAGVLGDTVRALQDAAILPGAHVIAFDASSVLPTGTWYGSLVTGLANIPVRPTELQAMAWLVYWVPVSAVFLFATRKSVRVNSQQPDAVRV
jgi:high-affinity iron transporter